MGIHRFFFEKEVNGTALWQAYWMGLRFDCRIVASISLLMILISLWPGLHFFKTSAGKFTSIVLYCLFTAGVLIFYTADFIYLLRFNRRLNGTLVSDLAKGTEKGGIYRHNIPWFALILVIAILLWLSFLFFRQAHKTISKSGGYDQKLVRIYWQSLVVIISCFLIYGRIGAPPLSESLASKQLSPVAAALAVTPPESFFTTLPIKKTSDVPPGENAGRDQSK